VVGWIQSTHLLKTHRTHNPGTGAVIDCVDNVTDYQ
jgi:hypothetical protein